MRSARTRGAALVGVLVLLLATAAVADVFLLDFYGYDYWSPYSPPYETMGNCYNALGFVPDANPLYLFFDYTGNEYTFSLRDVCWQSVVEYPPYKVWTFTGGTFDVYGDARVGGTHGDYGVNPPNASAPATFEDGENVLGGDVTTMQIVLNTATGYADLAGQLDLVRGTQLAGIPSPQRAGWTLAGLRGDTPLLPDGYNWQIDGQLFISDPVPVETRSWGGLKRSFLGGQ